MEMEFPAKITKILLLFILFIFTELCSQIGKDEFISLEKDFKDFEYEKVLDKGRYLLGSSSITKEDSLQIYQYMINAAYALNDTIQARGIIDEVLDYSSNFELDPKITSPKIIEFFEIVKKEKIEFPQKPKIPLDTLLTEEPKTSYAPNAKYVFTSIFLPGSAHILDGQKRKGYVFTSISVLFIGGIIYFNNNAAEKRDEYMNAQRGADFNQLYDHYNAAYKTRNLLILGYGLFSLYTLFDFLKSQKRENYITLDYSSNNRSFVIKITKTL